MVMTYRYVNIAVVAIIIIENNVLKMKKNEKRSIFVFPIDIYFFVCVFAYSDIYNYYHLFVRFINFAFSDVFILFHSFQIYIYAFLLS